MKLSEELCIHEMVPALCGYCAPDPDISNIESDKPLLGPIFVAQYGGVCFHCGKDIEVGDHIGTVMNEDGEYAHYGCGR